MTLSHDRSNRLKRSKTLHNKQRVHIENDKKREQEKDTISELHLIRSQAIQIEHK